MAKLTTSKKNLYNRLDDLNMRVNRYKIEKEDDPLQAARKGGVFDKIKILIAARTKEARDKL
jgi:hypothetical protein